MSYSGFWLREYLFAVSGECPNAHDFVTRTRYKSAIWEHSNSGDPKTLAGGECSFTLLMTGVWVPNTYTAIWAGHNTAIRQYGDSGDPINLLAESSILSHLPVDEFQMRTVLSLEPDTIRPSGNTAIAVTGPSWPTSVVLQCPVDEFQMNRFRSPDSGSVVVLRYVLLCD